MEAVHFQTLRPCVCLCVCVSVLGKIRSAVGSAQLLMSQKFQQFYWLCQQNLVRHQRHILAFKSMLIDACCYPSYAPRAFTSAVQMVWPRIQMQHTCAGLGDAWPMLLTLFTARFSDPKQGVDHSHAAAAEAACSRNDSLWGRPRGIRNIKPTKSNTCGRLAHSSLID